MWVLISAAHLLKGKKNGMIQRKLEWPPCKGDIQICDMFHIGGWDGECELVYKNKGTELSLDWSWNNSQWLQFSPARWSLICQT